MSVPDPKQTLRPRFSGEFLTLIKFKALGHELDLQAPLLE
jgi:hypothetical protein